MTDTDRLDAVAETGFATARAAVEAGRIPCATLGVIDAAGNCATRWSGMAAIEPVREALSEAHWFDLASLTKVIATTTRILMLAEEGRLDLDAPLTTAIPDLRQYDRLGAAERQLTFRDCLAHRTFLPAVEPIYTYGDDPDRLRAFVLQREWRQGPPVYSDINFILLGIAIERIMGAPLNTQNLNPGLSYAPVPGPAVATENCTWRGRVMKGEVHDENAFALGGRSGHAGLFGTIDGVLEFARALMAGELLSEKSIEGLCTAINGDRTLGWQRKHLGWHGGGNCSAATIGHLGFTGTGLWIDFDRRIAWALLTNHVHPSRHVYSGIDTVRIATGDAVIEAADRLRAA